MDLQTAMIMLYTIKPPLLSTGVALWNGMTANSDVQINVDLITLALYDIVIWADDSTSMSALDGGERINDLKAILSRVADAAVLFDDDGEAALFSSLLQSRYISDV